MRLAEVELARRDGTDLAIARGGPWIRDIMETPCDRATVLKVRQPRKARRGSAWSETTKNDGVLVRLVDSGQERMVTTRRCIAPWSVYAETKRSRAASEKRHSQERDRRQRLAQAAVKAFGVGHTAGTEVRLTAEDAEKLAARVLPADGVERLLDLADDFRQGHVGPLFAGTEGASEIIRAAGAKLKKLVDDWGLKS